MKKIIAIIVIIAFIILGVVYYRQKQANAQFNRQFTSGNGRLEATEIYIATKLPGRIEDIKVKEGQLVKIGQEIACMQTNSLKARMEQAIAFKKQAETKLKVALAQISVEESNLAAAQATVAQKKGLRDGAEGRFKRTAELRKTNTSTPQQYDDDKANFQAADGSYEAAKAQVLQAKAAVESAKANAEGAKANVAAAIADIKVIQTELDDSILKTPKPGRIQYRISQPGEVLQAGGKVVNLADLTDVYMTFFLPELDAGKLELGADVRIVLDAIPQYPQPAKISFIASSAQFTPKTVETKSERQKLMFRVKARMDPERLKGYEDMVKTGLPGVAYVKLDPNAKWPAFLEVKE